MIKILCNLEYLLRWFCVININVLMKNNLVQQITDITVMQANTLVINDGSHFRKCQLLKTPHKIFFFQCVCYNVSVLLT